MHKRRPGRELRKWGRESFLSCVCCTTLHGVAAASAWKANPAAAIVVALFLPLIRKELVRWPHDDDGKDSAKHAAKLRFAPAENVW